MTAVDPVRSITRAVDVLFALTRGPQSLGRLAEVTGLSKTTVHRVLASLSYQHLTVQDALTGNYLLGPGCFAIADAMNRGSGTLAVIAGPVLSRLHELTQETVTLHVRAGAQRVCAEEFPSQHAVRYIAGVGAASPIHTGSAGKVLLAFMDPDERDELLSHVTFTRLTEATITDRETLERELRLVRRRGYAESRGERVVGGAAVSAPVWGPGGRILAAVSVLGPDSRVTSAKLQEMRPLVIAAAQQISNRIVTADVSRLDKGKDHDDEKMAGT
jgi:DNA-binding IclR family transcriptional regulator